MNARSILLAPAVLGVLLACHTEPPMVQRKVTKNPVTPELARAIGSSFRVHGQASDPSQSLTDILAKAPVSTTAIALAPQGQLGPALAQIIRDPNAPYPVIIVFAEETLTDNLYPLANYLLAKDVKFVPQASSRRVLSILANGQLRLDADGKTKWARNSVQVQRAGANAAELHRRAAGARMITLDGIGRAKLVYDPPAP